MSRSEGQLAAGTIMQPMAPLTRLFDSFGGSTPSKDEPTFWNGRIPWVSPKDMKREVIGDAEDHVTETAVLAGRLRLVPPGSVLVVVRGMILDHSVPVALTTAPVTINQDMKALLPRPGVDARYLCLLLRGLKDRLLSTVEIAGHGTCCLRLDLWKKIMVGLPLLDEQRAIADFLDRKTAAIDAVVGRKERLVEMLAKKRQCLASGAVLRGCDPDAPSRLVEHDGIDNVPVHWHVERLKFRMRGIEQGWSPQCDNRTADPGEWGVLKVGCMNSRVYDEAENKALPSSEQPIPELEVRVGDVLMSRSNTVELVGSVGIVHETQGRILLCDKLYRLKFDETRLLPEYAVLLLRSHIARQQIERDASGASPSMKNISNDRVANLVLPFPPVREQRAILDWLRPRLEQMERVEARLLDSISRLRELRQVLISAAVMGKLSLTASVAAPEVVSSVEAQPLSATSAEPSQQKPKANSFFRRAVLAAEIAQRLHADPTFGRVKFQKVLYLAEHHLRLPDVQSQYKRAAAGPLDRRLMFSVEGQLQRQNWFKAESEGKGTKYVPMAKAGGHRDYWPRYWGEYQQQFDRLLTLMSAKWMDTEHAEMIATLYAAWNDFLLRNEPADDDRIVQEVLTNWNPSKQRIAEDRWRKALAWMRKEGLVPYGHGRTTETA